METLIRTTSGPMPANSLFCRADQVSDHPLTGKADILQSFVTVNHEIGNTYNGVLHTLPSIPSKSLRPFISTQSTEGNFPVPHPYTGSFSEQPNCWSCSLDHYAPRRQEERSLNPQNAAFLFACK